VYSLLAHLPHFLLGTLTAWMFAVWRPRPAEGSWGGAADAVLWIAAILVFVVLATPFDDVLRIPHGRYNLPFVPLLLCVVILLVPRTATGRVVFDSAPFRGLGAVSFGVYLYHLPIQHVTARVMERVSLAVPDHALLFGAASLVATIVVATLSYWIVERPIVRLARHA
jgi:peptidoglycan/LPS O-acetylase OafA/YrhL